jgi:hypothetical protein
MEETKFGALLPKKITKSLSAYGTELNHNEFLMIYIVLAGKLFSENKDWMKKAIQSIYGDDKNPVMQQMLSKMTSDKGIEEIISAETYQHYFGQMVFARSVDNFITYLKDLLGEVINKKPEILKSGEQEKLDFILSFNDMTELRNSIAEKKIEQLFYGGVFDINKYFEEKLKIILFDDSDDLQILHLIVRKRNLIVHNRGRINAGFKNEFPLEEGDIGDYVTFSYEDISNLNVVIWNATVEFDEKVSKKFNLDLYPNINP